MTNISRPLSPHLTIYRPQITAALSITHRITGVVLSLGVVAFIIISKVFTFSISNYTVYMWSFHLNNNIDWIAHSILFFLTFSLYYHLGNGIRHLYWDTVSGLELETIHNTGVILVMSSFATTVLTWILFAGS